MIHNCPTCNKLYVEPREYAPCPLCGSFENFLYAMIWTMAVTLEIPIELLLKPYKVEDA